VYSKSKQIKMLSQAANVREPKLIHTGTTRRNSRNESRAMHHKLEIPVALNQNEGATIPLSMHEARCQIGSCLQTFASTVPCEQFGTLARPVRALLLLPRATRRKPTSDEEMEQPVAHKQATAMVKQKSEEWKRRSSVFSTWMRKCCQRKKAQRFNPLGRNRKKIGSK